jgi:hypothetical protein
MNALIFLKFSLTETLKDDKYKFVLPQILRLADTTPNLTSVNVEDRYHELIGQANSMVEHHKKMIAAAAADANDDDSGPIRRSDGGRKRASHVKKRSGGKWSMKYKRGINCSAPRGFSQRQYCKYGRRKTAKK